MRLFANGSIVIDTELFQHSDRGIVNIIVVKGGLHLETVQMLSASEKFAKLSVLLALETLKRDLEKAIKEIKQEEKQ